jgi:hypothetical protein
LLLGRSFAIRNAVSPSYTYHTIPGGRSQAAHAGGHGCGLVPGHHTRPGHHVPGAEIQPARRRPARIPGPQHKGRERARDPSNRRPTNPKPQRIIVLWGFAVHGPMAYPGRVTIGAGSDPLPRPDAHTSADRSNWLGRARSTFNSRSTGSPSRISRTE